MSYVILVVFCICSAVLLLSGRKKTNTLHWFSYFWLVRGVVASLCSRAIDVRDARAGGKMSSDAAIGSGTDGETS